MKTVIQPQPQLWRGHSPWSQEYWLFCNRLYNSLELADLERQIEGEERMRLPTTTA